MRDGAGAVGGPFARPFRRFAAVSVSACIACSGYGHAAARRHAAIGWPGSGRVQGRFCHVRLGRRGLRARRGAGGHLTIATTSAASWL